jgi:hypothetical protein
MRIGHYEFDGPLDAVDDLKAAPGLCAVVNVTGAGACLLVGVRYATNVKEATARLITDPTWRKRVGEGQLKYGVRYTGPQSEAELQRAQADLDSQYLVPCVL